MIRQAAIADRLIGCTIMGVLVGTESIAYDYDFKTQVYPPAEDTTYEPICIILVDKDGHEETLIVNDRIILASALDD